MEIRIVLDELAPPAGVVYPMSDLNGRRPAPVPFVGWLGLLRALADLLPGTPDR